MKLDFCPSTGSMLWNGYTSLSTNSILEEREALPPPPLYSRHFAHVSLGALLERDFYPGPCAHFRGTWLEIHRRQAGGREQAMSFPGR